MKRLASLPAVALAKEGIAWLDEKRGNIPDVERSDSHQDIDATVNIPQQASLSKIDAVRLRQEQYLQPQRGTLRTAWVQVTCALAIELNTPEKDACGECTIKQVQRDYEKIHSDLHFSSLGRDS